MKKSVLYKTVGVLILAAMVIAAAFLLLSRQDSAQAQANAALRSVFSYTQSEYDGLQSVVNQVSEEQQEQKAAQVMTNYLEQHYPGVFSETGMEKAIQNRVFSRVMEISQENVADVTVSKVTLESRSTNEQSRQFDYTLTQQSGQQSNTMSGVVEVAQSNGTWKVENITINN